MRRAIKGRMQEKLERRSRDLEAGDTSGRIDQEPERGRAVLHARVYASLGDGYWRLEDKAKAKETWARGAERFPDDPGLKRRRQPDDRAVADEVFHALYAGTRVDTSLRGWVP